MSLQFGINHLAVTVPLNEKMESFWPKKLSHWGELKFYPGFRVIGEYLSQIDSTYRVNLTQIFSNYSEYRGRILFPPVTQLFRSKWLHFSFSVADAEYSAPFAVWSVSLFFSLLVSEAQVSSTLQEDFLDVGMK